MIPLRKATKKQKLKLYEEIISKLIEEEDEDIRVELLPRLVKLLDDLDMDELLWDSED